MDSASSNIADKIGSQEMAISLTEGVSTLFGDQLVPKDQGSERTARHKLASETEVSELMRNGEGKKLAIAVLKPFLAKLALAGIEVGKNAARKQEEPETSGASKDMFEDRAKIMSRPDVIQQIKKLGQHNNGSSSGGSSKDDNNSLLQQFALLQAENAAQPAQELADRLKEIRAKLKERGISDNALLKLESASRRGEKIDLAEIIKEALVFQQLSGTKLEKLTYGRGIAELLKKMDPREAKQLLADAREKAKGELKGFVLEELENTLIKKTFMQDQNFSDALKLLNVGDKVGLDYSSWLDNVWSQKKDNHGLNLIDVPPSATGTLVDTSTDNPSNRSRKHGFEYEKKDESEILINRLRALYMQRALKGDAFTHLQTEFKVRKLKNGLFQLGIMTEKMDDQIKHEAEIVAKVKILEMLKEALIERATFYELAGPANQLVERKIKGLISNAERLGMPISTEEFNLMRDNANRRVFDISKTELGDLLDKRAVKDSPKLDKKENLILKLLSRLKEESAIEIGIPANC